jgi:hypothetical protein
MKNGQKLLARRQQDRAWTYGFQKYHRLQRNFFL